jgi:nicotinate-nucleotide adenylyltransferase
VFAQEAASELGLDEVLLVPVGVSPYKEIEAEPGPEVRLEMARLAARTDPLLGASDIETIRDGASFTYRTLELLSEQRAGDDFTFLVGADVAAGLTRWRQPERVLELARLAVATRPGTAVGDAEEALERLGAGDRARIVEIPEIGVSSSGIRRRVATGRPIRHLVPDPVVELIGERGLYRT